MTTLVIGAGPGMGLAIATALGRGHGPVGLIARRPAPLQRLVATLADRDVKATAHPADITDDEALHAAIEHARQTSGPPEIVVFNASLYRPGTPTTIRLEDFRLGLDTGLTAALVTLQATATDLIAAAPRSALLFTGNGLAITPSAASIGLSVQKAGLRHLAYGASQELSKLGVHVGLVTIKGNIAPGTAFDPERIAAVYADLATPGIDRPVEVTFTGDGPDWVA